MLGFPNYEYRNNNIRYVYFLKSKDKVNEYAGIYNRTLTIRGIKVGDSVNKVLKLYGKSWYYNETTNDFYKGESALIYRFYNYHNTSDDKYPCFDYIQFELENGIIKGIHFWRKANDAP